MDTTVLFLTLIKKASGFYIAIWPSYTHPQALILNSLRPRKLTDVLYILELSTCTALKTSFTAVYKLVNPNHYATMHMLHAGSVTGYMYT